MELAREVVCPRHYGDHNVHEKSGAHSANDFPLVIQMWWKDHLVVVIATKWSFYETFVTVIII